MSDPRRSASASKIEAKASASERAYVPDGARQGAPEPKTRTSQRQPRYMMLFDALLAALLLVAASPVARHWIGMIVSNVCILGGIVAAPLVSMVAWIGLALPTHALLHQIAPMLVATSLVWFFLAIVGAHALRLDQRKPE